MTEGLAIGVMVLVFVGVVAIAAVMLRHLPDERE